MPNTSILYPSFSDSFFFFPRFGRFSLKSFLTLGFISIILLSIIYIFQVNFLAYQIHTLENYEKQIIQLSEENKILEINFSKASSLDNIENYLSNQNFQKINQIKYIRATNDTEIAKNFSTR